jgi:hypothetical protein
MSAAEDTLTLIYVIHEDIVLSGLAGVCQAEHGAAGRAYGERGAQEQQPAVRHTSPFGHK